MKSIREQIWEQINTPIPSLYEMYKDQIWMSASDAAYSDGTMEAGND